MILEDNLATIMLTKRIGFKFKGFTTDEWEGRDKEHRYGSWNYEICQSYIH